MEAEEKIGDIFLGSLKVKRRKNGKEFMVGYICLENVYDKMPENMIHERNGLHYAPIIIQRNSTGPNKDGSTHSISIDSYFPKKKNNLDKK